MKTCLQCPQHITECVGLSLDSASNSNFQRMDALEGSSNGKTGGSLSLLQEIWMKFPVPDFSLAQLWYLESELKDLRFLSASLSNQTNIIKKNLRILTKNIITLNHLKSFKGSPPTPSTEKYNFGRKSHGLESKEIISLFKSRKVLLWEAVLSYI